MTMTTTAGTTPVPLPSPSATGQRDGGTLGGRNRYLDTLRAAALARVLLFHLFGWVWLPLLFPSMGVMFALAGSLMAASLDRHPSTRIVLLQRMRRLLPPLWVMGLVLVPVMLAQGWTATTEDAQPFGPAALSWLLPITSPPGSDLGQDWTTPLWYLRTYLWLVLLSPPLLWLWRHWPKTMFVLPLLGVALLSAGFLQVDSELGDGVASLLTFAACWMVGFAHHDGMLQKVRLGRILVLGVMLSAAGVVWAVRYPLPDTPSPAVGDIPMAAALFSLGFSLVLLRLPLRLSALERMPVLRGVVDVVNRRAVTIYLWGNVAIFLAWEVVDRYVSDVLPSEGWEQAVVLGLTLLILFGITLLVGWVEDLAARRRPRLLPLGTGTGRVAPARRGRQAGDGRLIVPD